MLLPPSPHSFQYYPTLRLLVQTFFTHVCGFEWNIIDSHPLLSALPRSSGDFVMPIYKYRKETVSCISCPGDVRVSCCVAPKSSVYSGVSIAVGSWAWCHRSAEIALLRVWTVFLWTQEQKSTDWTWLLLKFHQKHTKRPPHWACPWILWTDPNGYAFKVGQV